MHQPHEMQIKLNELKHSDLLHQAQQARLFARYLRETKAQRSWRFRLAEMLLQLATTLSPYHRTIIQMGRKSGGTMVAR